MDTKLNNASVKIEKMSMVDIKTYQMRTTIVNNVKSFSVGTQTQEIKVIFLNYVYFCSSAVQFNLNKGTVNLLS